MLHIVLHEPEIPFNTGAIARTCVATGSSLHMIRPYGFVINDKMIRRAGMDYWPKVDLHEYVDFEDFLRQNPFLDAQENLSKRDSLNAQETLVRRDSLDAQKTCGSHNSPRAQEVPGVAGTCARQEASARRDSPDGQTVSSPQKLWYATTKAHQLYTDVHFGPDDYIMFGKESGGIPEEILVDHEPGCIRIPMWGDIRSLNLSNSVAIILYEALRQNHFEHLSDYGELHHLHWKTE